MSLVTLEDDNETENDAPVIEDDKTDVQVGGDDDKTPSERPGGQPEGKKSRKERREETKFDFKSEIRQRDAELQRLRADSEARAREFAELKGRFEERHSKDNEGAHEKKIDGLMDQANEHLRAAHAAGQAGDHTRSAREMKAYYKTLNEMHRVDAQASKASERPDPRSQDTGNPIDRLPPEVITDIKRIFNDYPWMHDNYQARAQTDLLINQMTSSGYPNNYATMAAAATHVAMQMKIGGGGGASPSQRQRYAGVGGGEGGEAGGTQRTVKMGEHERKMAEAWGRVKYPKASAEEAHVLWAREVGAKIPQQR